MRLIDLDRIKPMDFPSTEMDGFDAVRYLNALPTIDAVPVVRCRECKYRKYDDIFGMIWCNLDSCAKRVKPYDFCSHGERKEGDE